jgi:hypothetical protein
VLSHTSLLFGVVLTLCPLVYLEYHHRHLFVFLFLLRISSLAPSPQQVTCTEDLFARFLKENFNHSDICKIVNRNPMY